MAACEAARRVHDAQIGKGRVYHLFRLPHATEQKLQRHALTQDDTTLVREKGVAGAKEALDRPGLTDLFVALKANRVRTVLVENATRVARDLMVIEIILSEFRKLDVKVISADGGVDLTLGNDDPTGKLVRQILAAVSEWEKCLIVQKLRASRLRIRRSGGHCEGRKAFGTTPEEQVVVEKLLRRLKLAAFTVTKVLLLG